MTDKIRSLSDQALSDVLANVAVNADVSQLEQAALLQAAEDAQAKAKRKTNPVLELSSLATPGEVQRARRTRAVKRGKDVYLPSWRELATAMPNLLARSALWTVRAPRDITSESSKQACATLPNEDLPPCDLMLANPGPQERSIPVLGDATLINRGPLLGAHDRRVFATCLDFYREDRALSDDGESTWVEVSYFKFLGAQGVAYHVNSHKSLRSSLERLSAMSLHVRHQGMEIQMPRILEVSFQDGEARGSEPMKSDLIMFRVLEPFAQLYGTAKWTAIPHDALNAGAGLKSWLACFYSTHSAPFSTSLAKLHLLTGSAAPFPKFKVQLRDALTALMSPDQPRAVRIKSFEMTSESVTVHMLSWSQ